MAGPLQQLVHKRGYRERKQAAHRSHKHKTLEKKRDWQQRSRRYKKQQKLLQHLSEKARTKNPNEFSCKLLRAQQIGGGVDGIKTKNAGLVRLARADAAAAFAARTPAGAAAAVEEVLRTSALSSLVSKRSASRLQQTKRQLKRARESAASGAAALLQLKEQTLRQRVKKQAAALGRGFVKGGKPNKHILLDKGQEDECSETEKTTLLGQQQQEGAKDEFSDVSESDSQCRWLLMAKTRRRQPEPAPAEKNKSSGGERTSEGDVPDSAKPYQEMHKALLHAQRLRRLQQQLQQHREEQKGGRRKQIVTKGKDGKEIKCTKWFLERKK